MASTTQAQSQITVITDAKQSINEFFRLEMQAADLKNQRKESKKAFYLISRKIG